MGRGCKWDTMEIIPNNFYQMDTCANEMPTGALSSLLNILGSADITLGERERERDLCLSAVMEGVGQHFVQRRLSSTAHPRPSREPEEEPK